LSSVYNKTSTDAAVGRLVVAVTQAIQTAVPIACLQKCKFPAWVSDNLKYYPKKKNKFYRCLWNVGLIVFMTYFYSYRRLVKATIKCDELS
jgi:hypothetical protein